MDVISARRAGRWGLAGKLAEVTGWCFDMPWDFKWDAVKAQGNLTKHGVTFEQAASVLTDPLALTVFDKVHSTDEERWFTLGVSREGKLFAVSHTFEATGPNWARIRIISAREPTSNERRQYQDEPR